MNVKERIQAKFLRKLGRVNLKSQHRENIYKQTEHDRFMRGILHNLSKLHRTHMNFFA